MFQFSRQFMVLALTGLLVGGCAGLSVEPGEPIASDVRMGEPLSADNGQASDAMYEVMVGELAGRMGNVDEAVAHYSRAAEYSDDPRIAERATRIALFAGDFDRAIETALNWERLEPGNMEAQRTLALLFVKADRLDESVDRLDRLVTSDAENGGGYMAAAAVLSGANDRDGALDAMALLVERHAGDARAHLAYANLALKLEDHAAAASASAKALSLDPALSPARVLRSKALFSMGNTREALDEMQGVVAANPDNFALRFTYGRMLVRAKEYDRARKVFAQLLAQRPEHPDLLYTQGLLDLQLRRYADARVYFTRLAKTGKRTNESYYYLGRIAEETGDEREALSRFGRVEEGEYFLDAHARAATIYLRRGELSKATAHFELLRDRVGDADTGVQLYLAEGQILRDASEFGSAMEVYNRALTEYPNNADLLYARAMTAEKLDRMDLLEADLKTILETDPENATALNALGYTLADRNERIDEALDYIRRALELRPGDPTVIDSMGWVQYRLGNYEKAERYLRQAFELLQDPEIAGHLSEIMWVQGNRSEARQLLHEALSQHPEDNYLRELKTRFAR